MFELLLAVPALLIGLCVRRWWTVGLSIPVGVWAAYEIPLENTEPPHPELGLAVAGLVALFLMGGVALGILTRTARR